MHTTVTLAEIDAALDGGMAWSNRPTQKETVRLVISNDGFDDPDTGEPLGMSEEWMDAMQALVGHDRDLMDVPQDEWDMFAPLCDRLEIAANRRYG